MFSKKFDLFNQYFKLNCLIEYFLFYLKKKILNLLDNFICEIASITITLNVMI